MQRPFSSGSRQTPDPCDQFLEEHNLYRKHTARDSSCLFRVISEQMYDTQMHHYDIRKKCVRYMRKHHSFFDQLVDQDFDDYLNDMSKMKAYGSLLELQALGYMFRRNVVLYEPFNLGNIHINRSFHNDVFRVFYSSDRHFDSVFTSEFIKKTAICQTICYELLYKDLFMLPDVTFAVEQMLHPLACEGSGYVFESNAAGYCTAIHFDDGRSFEFDLPENTACILENFKLCHFHYVNFPEFSNDLQREMRLVHTDIDDYGRSALPDKFTSCVRQLLQEGITPFPYKVAKALDPHMYRNIEFDSWNEIRKENKLQNWYNGDYNFKVGAKCHVNLRKSEGDIYTCHIQEIGVDRRFCIVFIEQLGEKRMVPLDSLFPLSSEEFRPWSLPYRLQRHMRKYSSVRFTRHFNCRFKLNGRYSTLTHEYSGPLASHFKARFCDFANEEFTENSCDLKTNTSSYYKLKQFTHLENFRTDTIEYCAMPFTVKAESQVGDHADNSNKLETPKMEPLIGCVENSSNETATTSTIATMGVGERQQENFSVVPYRTNNIWIPTDQQSYYTVNPYAMPNECIGYEYDAAGNLLPPGTTLVPTAYGSACCAGNQYYYYQPAPPPADCFVQPTSNIYIQTPSSTIPAPTECDNNYLANNPYVFSNTLPRPSNYISTLPVTAPTAYGRTDMVNLTPTDSNILNAAKSLKANASDMPTDMATLRYYYNLGLECHRKHLKRPVEGEALSTDQFNNIVASLPRLNINQNQRKVQFDSNNNTIDNDKKFQSNGYSQQQTRSQSNESNYKQNHNNVSSAVRRYSTRYYNNKDRQSYQRTPFTNSAGSSANAVSAQKTQRIQNEYHLRMAALNKNDGSQGREMNRSSHQVGNGPKSTGQQARNQNSFNMQGSNTAQQTIRSYTPLARQPFNAYGSYDFRSAESNEMKQLPYGSYGVGQPVGMRRPPLLDAGAIYSVPPPPPPPLPTAVNSQFNAPSTYAAVPRSNFPGGFYAPGSEMHENIVDPMQYQCMNYPPPIPYYYANGIANPSTFVASPMQLQAQQPQIQLSSISEATRTVAVTSAGMQGYWSYAPPSTMQAPVSYTEAGVGNVTHATASAGPILLVSNANGTQNFSTNNRDENQEILPPHQDLQQQ